MLEQHRFLGESRDARRGGPFVAVARQVIGAQGVDYYQNDIGPPISSGQSKSPGNRRAGGADPRRDFGFGNPGVPA